MEGGEDRSSGKTLQKVLKTTGRTFKCHCHALQHLLSQRWKDVLHRLNELHMGVTGSEIRSFSYFQSPHESQWGTISGGLTADGVLSIQYQVFHSSESRNEEYRPHLSYSIIVNLKLESTMVCTESTTLPHAHEDYKVTVSSFSYDAQIPTQQKRLE